MNAAKYLFALWAGVLIYASLSVIFGAMGFSAHRQLEKEQIKQEANMEELAIIGRDLENVMNSLLYDKDTLAVYAREHGYASRSERFIRIVGLGTNQKNRIYAGEVVVAAEPQFTPDRDIRVIALCAGITIIICMAFSDFLKSLKEPGLKARLIRKSAAEPDTDSPVL
ncbi:MAG: septum formation initiator family protein [Treponema sp.]|jgi:cell division protein FtsB|nr:septum formation initiator family protein [Treponema sp.]